MLSYVAAYELLVQVSLGALVLLGLAGLAAALVREPARKARLIELAMLSVLVLPLLALVPGVPRLNVLPAIAERSQGETVDPPIDWESPLAPSEEAVVPQNSEDLAQRRKDAENLLMEEAASEPSALVEGEPMAKPIEASVAPSVEAPQAPSPPAMVVSTRQPLADYRLWIVAAYSAGVAWMLLWSLVGLLAVRRLVRTADAADATVRDALRSLAGPQSQRVRLLVSDRMAQPCAFGWWRPTIVLPRSLAAAGEAELRFALAHEWSHVSRGDIVAWLVAGAARSLYFYQPLVWLLREQLRLSQDYLADAAAAGTSCPEDYAEFLTSVSRNFARPRFTPGLGIAGRRSNLHRRVVMLVENAKPLERVAPRRWNLLTAVLMIVALSVVARAGVQENPGEAKGAPTTLTVEFFPGSEGEGQAVTADGQPGEAGQSRTPVDRTNYEQALESDPTLRDLDEKRHLFLVAQQRLHVPSELAKVRVGLARDIERIQLNLDERRDMLRANLVGAQQAARQPISPSSLNKSIAQDPLVKALDRQWEHRQELLAWMVATEESGDFRRLNDTLSAAIRKLDWQIEARKAQLHLATRRIQPGDRLTVQIVGTLPGVEPTSVITVQPDGSVPNPARSAEWALGSGATLPPRMSVAGKNLDEAEAAFQELFMKAWPDHEVVVLVRYAEPEAPPAEESNAAWRNTHPPATPYRIQAGDLLSIQFSGGLAKVKPNPRLAIVEPDGSLVLGVILGEDDRVHLSGKTLTEAEVAILEQVKGVSPEVQVVLKFLGWRDPDSAVAAPSSIAWGRAAAPVAFSGKLRPGDIVNVEIVGSIPGAGSREATVEPDGNIALGAHYGRVNVRDKSLVEAGQLIEARLKELVKSPQVQVTYLRHDPNVSAEGQGGAEEPGSSQADEVERLKRELEELRATIRELKK